MLSVLQEEGEEASVVFGPEIRTGAALRGLWAFPASAGEPSLRAGASTGKRGHMGVGEGADARSFFKACGFF